uniref:Uncharacterized protein n=1 Tax=Chromera velia CCMP2878 TaxID=1169474 RepID=A0A0G4F3K9_9ALVE|eukprot:Cvel_2673.t1-p1 / transcript=Cvel_2673.t1 / gene=Cvel_2673 / organism=Chromera_velia_CCMP2878 / gene_product=hypothetical protein / transcript_product=hypothetical protein / location=Cvel_scaffold106:126513-127956(-) / protein_length=357 / sequence_SO=supercontig / SO=protein_coding / is_pseudo=false
MSPKPKSATAKKKAAAKEAAEKAAKEQEQKALKNAENRQDRATKDIQDLQARLEKAQARAEKAKQDVQALGQGVAEEPVVPLMAADGNAQQQPLQGAAAVPAGHSALPLLGEGGPEPVKTHARGATAAGMHPPVAKKTHFALQLGEGEENQVVIPKRITPEASYSLVQALGRQQGVEVGQSDDCQLVSSPNIRDCPPYPAVLSEPLQTSHRDVAMFLPTLLSACPTAAQTLCSPPAKVEDLHEDLFSLSANAVHDPVEPGTTREVAARIIPSDDPAELALKRRMAKPDRTPPVSFWKEYLRRVADEESSNLKAHVRTLGQRHDFTKSEKVIEAAQMGARIAAENLRAAVLINRRLNC